MLTDEEQRIEAALGRRDFADMMKALGKAIAVQLAEPTWGNLKNVQARAAALLLYTAAKECGVVASAVNEDPKRFCIGADCGE